MIAICIFSLLASVDFGAGHRPATPSSVLLLADAGSAQTTTAPEATSRPSLRNDPRAIRWRKTLFWSTLILFVGIVASIAIVRFSRRYAAYLKEGPSTPTASEDVWAMHRLPPNAVEDATGDAASEDPDEPPDDDDDGNGNPPPS